MFKQFEARYKDDVTTVLYKILGYIAYKGLNCDWLLYCPNLYIICHLLMELDLGKEETMAQ